MAYRPEGRDIMIMFFVYAIQSIPTKQIYIGQTKDIEERLRCHNSGYVKSAKARKPWVLLAFEEFEDRNKARWLERELKKSKGRRLRWIEKNHINAGLRHRFQPGGLTGRRGGRGFIEKAIEIL